MTSVKVDEPGTEFARKLVEQNGWRAYYWNPDARLAGTRDRINEHSVTYAVAKAKKSYYGIPVTGLVVDYHPKGAAANREPFAGLQFGYGITVGGYHNFLIRDGKICEVHWDGAGYGDPNNLYEYDSSFIGWGEYIALEGALNSLSALDDAIYQAFCDKLNNTNVPKYTPVMSLDELAAALQAKGINATKPQLSARINVSPLQNLLRKGNNADTWRVKIAFLSGIVVVPPDVNWKP
jgi:hypothetical protein